MISIGHVLLSDQVINDQFVCDLNKCKGGCCVDGDAGAPLTKDELKQIDEVHAAVLPYLATENKAQLLQQGRYVFNKEFGWVTPTIKSKVCVYGVTDKRGIVKCGIEQAYNDGKISWKKPISCHLFPLRIKQSRDKKTDYVNYEPRESLCSPACSLGKKLKVAVYVFLKDALIRKYGAQFYDALENTAQYMHLNNKTDAASDTTQKSSQSH